MQLFSGQCYDITIAVLANSTRTHAQYLHSQSLKTHEFCIANFMVRNLRVLRVQRQYIDMQHIAPHITQRVQLKWAVGKCKRGSLALPMWPCGHEEATPRARKRTRLGRQKSRHCVIGQCLRCKLGAYDARKPGLRTHDDT